MSYATAATQRYTQLTRLFVALMISGCVIGIILPAGIRWDFAVFYDAGRRALAGDFGNLFHPDAPIAGQAPQGGLAFWAAPLSAFLYAPMALLNPLAAMVAFKIQNTAAYLLGLFLLYRHLHPIAAEDETTAGRFAATFAGMALLFQPFWTVFRVGGQTTPTVFLLLVLALLAHTRQRFLLCAVLLSVAVMIKPAFAPALVLLALISGRRFLVSTAGVLSVLGALSLLLIGWNVHEEFLRLMMRGSLQSSVSWPYSSSLYVAFTSLEPLVGPASAARLGVIATGLKLAVVGMIVFLLVRGHAQKLPRAAQLHFHFLVAIAFFLFTSEILWEHYLTVIFFILAYVVAARRYFTPAALKLVAAILIFSIGQNLILVNLVERSFQFDSPLSVLAASAFKSASVLLTLILLLWHHRSFLRSYTDPYWTTLQAGGAPAPAQTGLHRHRGMHSTAVS